MSERITSLQRLHEVQLEELCTIRDLCAAQGVRWFLHGGTMLGALRHGGPIPWDDDIDIALLHEDFERFKRLVVPQLPANLRFSDHRADTEFFDFVPRIIDTAYEFKTHASYAARFGNELDHPAIDIFVFVPAPPEKIDGKQSLKLTMNYAKALGHRPFIDHAEFSGVAKIASYILPALGRRKTIAQLMSERDRLAAWGDAATGRYRIVNDLPTYMHLRFEASWYELPAAGERLVDFSGELLPVPAGAENELDLVYKGRWREYPPVDAREPMHAALRYEAHANDCPQGGDV